MDQGPVEDGPGRADILVKKKVNTDAKPGLVKQTIFGFSSGRAIVKICDGREKPLWMIEEQRHREIDRSSDVNEEMT